MLGWASPLFHYGALAAIGGHVIGLCIPRVGDRGARDLARASTAGSPGSPAGSPATATLIGFAGLLYRRAISDRVRRTTTRMDMLTYFLLTVLIVMGCWMTFGYTLFTDDPDNYRASDRPVVAVALLPRPRRQRGYQARR